jgi:hypothetical protein
MQRDQTASANGLDGAGDHGANGARQFAIRAG